MDNVKMKLTIPIPINKPDKNGRIFTDKAIENAVGNLKTNLPINYKDNESGTKLIGNTTGNSHIVVWDSKNQVCKITVDGVVFCSDLKIRINEMENDKISNFEILGIDLTINNIKFKGLENI